MLVTYYAENFIQVPCTTLSHWSTFVDQRPWSNSTITYRLVPFSSLHFSASNHAIDFAPEYHGLPPMCRRHSRKAYLVSSKNSFQVQFYAMLVGGRDIPQCKRHLDVRYIYTFDAISPFVMVASGGCGSLSLGCFRCGKTTKRVGEISKLGGAGYLVRLATFQNQPPLTATGPKRAAAKVASTFAF